MKIAIKTIILIKIFFLLFSFILDAECFDILFLICLDLYAYIYFFPDDALQFVNSIKCNFHNLFKLRTYKFHFYWHAFLFNTFRICGPYSFSTWI